MKEILRRVHYVLSQATGRTRIKTVVLLWVSAFFLHAVADPLITYIAVKLLEVGIETNPFMRTWLNAGPGAYLLAHFPLYAVGVGGFLILRWLLRRGSERDQRHVYYISVVALSAINIWGIVLVCNNLWVIWTAS